MSHASDISSLLDFWRIASLKGPKKNEIKELFCDSFYYPNVCPVCLQIRGEAQEWCYCKRCKLIAYCNPEHMKWDTFKHNTFCAEFLNWCEPLTPESFFLKIKMMETDDRLKLLSEYIMFLEEKIRLRYCERDILKCMRRCEACGECDPELLKNCPRCPQANFCIEKHLDDPRTQAKHESVCSSYTLCWILDVYEVVFKDYDILGHLILMTISRFEMTKQPLKNIWTMLAKSPDVLQEIGKKCNFFQFQFNTSENIKYLQCYISHFLSNSMTVMYAFESLGLLQKEKILIHVIGSTFYELQGLSQWEIILHRLPSSRKLKVVFVGPDVEQPEENKISKLCKACTSRGKTLSFEFHNVLYQEYLKYEQQMKDPSLVVAFNPGFAAYNSWKNCLLNLGKHKSAFMFTSYSKIDAECDQNEIQEILGQGTSYFYFDENPYASLRPKRFIDPYVQALVYKNTYITIYKSLSSQVQEKTDTHF